MAFKNETSTDGSTLYIPVTRTKGAVFQPTSGSVTLVEEAVGHNYKLTFTLSSAAVPVSDTGVSGSLGTLKLYTCPQGAVTFQGCRQNYTKFAESTALAGGSGDVSFEIGVGTATMVSVADGILNDGDLEDIGTAIVITLSGGTGTGTGVTGGKTAAHDGTSTATSIYLNWSGTAATVDADGFIYVTGTITVLYAFMDDD